MLTLSLILLPLIAGVLLLFLRGSSESLVKNIALLAADVEFILAGYAFYSFKDAPKGLLDVRYTWMKVLSLNFLVGMDGISLLLVALTAFLIPLILLSTAKITYKNPATFYALILFAEAALIGVFTAKDAFLFYIFYEIALVPVYFLAGIWGGQDAPRVTFKMFIFTMFGSLLMLVALVFLYIHGQSSDISSLYQVAMSLDKTTQNLL